MTRSGRLIVSNLQWYVSQRNWGNNTEEQRRNGEKRWSICLKLRAKNGYWRGYLGTAWQSISNDGLKLLSLLSNSPASMQIQNASSLCFTGSWPRLRSEEPKLTCRQFTPTINDFRNVRWYLAAVPNRAPKKSAFNYSERRKGTLSTVFKLIYSPGKTTLSRVECIAVWRKSSSSAVKMSGSLTHMFETKC